MDKSRLIKQSMEKKASNNESLFHRLYDELNDNINYLRFPRVYECKILKVMINASEYQADITKELGRD